ncbi:MAG: endonuclease/exonuclease/phosphatase family protein [Planctomycetaceae bacterium]
MPEGRRESAPRSLRLIRQMATLTPVGGSERTGATRRRRRRGARLPTAARVARGCAWAYLGLVVALAAMLWSLGDWWWPATLLTFGPRWVVLLPAPFVALLAVAFHRHSLLVLGGALILALGPFVDFRIPWRTLVGGSRGAKLRVVTYNAGSGGGDQQRVAEFLQHVRPDVVVLVEWGKGPTLNTDFEALVKSWYRARSGGIVIASRFPITERESLKSPSLSPWNHPGLACVIEAPSGPVHITGVHLETPREGLEAVRWMGWRAGDAMEVTSDERRVESALASELASRGAVPALVLGDFNMPIDSQIYRKDWGHWKNAFSIAGLGLGHTKFTNFFGIRIDHVLASRHWNARAAWVGPDLGGDHRPLVADLELIGTPPLDDDSADAIVKQMIREDELSTKRELEKRSDDEP